MVRNWMISAFAILFLPSYAFAQVQGNLGNGAPVTVPNGAPISGLQGNAGGGGTGGGGNAYGIGPQVGGGYGIGPQVGGGYGIGPQVGGGYGIGPQVGGR